MDILKLRDENLEEFLSLRDLNHVLFKKKLIDLYTQKKNHSSSGIDSTFINGKSLKECDLFSSKKDLSLAFWYHVLKRNKNVGHTFSTILPIPGSIQRITGNLFELENKSSFDREEISQIMEYYTILYEAIQNLLVPFFEDLAKENKSHNRIYWSDISKNLENKFKKKLFVSMRGDLRNAISHGSMFINGEELIWIKEDKSEEPYNAKKLVEKTIDLFYLMWVLHWGLGEVIVTNGIKNLKSKNSVELKQEYERKFKLIEENMRDEQSI